MHPPSSPLRAVLSSGLYRRDESDDLRDLFQGQDLKKSTKVLIKWSPGEEGSLEVGVVGGATLNLKSMQLAQALFDVYVGDDPIAPKALEAFKAGASKL